VCATLKIKPVPSTMGLMRDAIYLKLKLNEPSPAEAAASRRAEEEAAAAKVATAAAAKTAKAEGHDLDERLQKRPKPKPPFGPPPQAEEECIMHVDSQSDCPFWENVASGVVVWQNPLRAKPPAPPPPAVVGPGGTPASALSVASAGFDANALGGGSGSGVGGGGGGEILRVPCAPSGTLTLVGCCYMRKLPRKDTKPIWVGPRVAGGRGGFRLGFVGADTTALLDWHSGLHRAQTARWERHGNSSSGSAGYVGSGRPLAEWCENLQAAAQEMWAEAATQEALAKRQLGTSAAI
jgi:hypothetical protein